MIKLLKRITDVAKKKVAKKVVKKATKKKVAKKVAKKATKKKVAKKVAKKATEKKAPKKVAKKATKKKVAKKVAKKAPEEKVAKIKKNTSIKATSVKSKTEETKIVEIPSPIVIPAVEVDPYEPENDDFLDDEAPTETEEPAGQTPALNEEYNPDDESDNNAFGYGWSYDEGLDSPEEIEDEDEEYDEDAEYARGKAVGINLDSDDDEE